MKGGAFDAFDAFDAFTLGGASGQRAAPGFELFYVRKVDDSGFEPFQVRKADDSGWETLQVRTNG